MAPHFHLLTLGAPLLVTAAGEQIRFRTRKHFALLIRLAVEAGKRFTRDYLMDLLWRNAPSHLARHSLAQALSVLKEKVGREHLVVQRATVALAEGAVQADVSRLDVCDLQIRGAFLDGFEVPAAAAFEQWKDEWRAKLGPRIRDCLVKQMDAGRRIGDYATVERHALVLHELDPLSEDAVRGLMEARAWVGDRTNALKAFGRFEVDLAAELGAKPSADLARVADLLREGRRAAPRPQAAEQKPERQERRFEAETLIGRERDFARLYDAWLEVRRRTPRIVVMTGDPGVGKTTLTNAFVSTCQMEGAVVARAQAYDAERELPFAILAELIKQLTLQRAIGAADPEALSELSRVSPEIFNVFPGVPKPVEWSAEVIPLRLADAFLKAVVAATDESPLVLVVDDIHAADNASAAILHVMARKLPRTRLLLILTGRTNELRSTAAPSALVSDTSVAAMQTVELEPLSPDAAERLVAAVAARSGGLVGEVPSARIVRAGNGNALALELLTREWVAHGSSSLLSDVEALNTQPVANLGIPRAIGAVFERQVRRLDTATRAALDLAAVLGRRLADLPLYEVVGLTSAGAGEALSRLREEGFLREVHGGLEFRNELIRAEAYYSVAAPARQHLHRQVGEMLGAQAERDEQVNKLEVAWHLLRGGSVERASGYAIEGAALAIGRGAPTEADQILTVVANASLPTETLQRVQILLATALLDQSKADTAMPIIDGLVLAPDLSVHDFARVWRMKAAAEYLMNRKTGRCYWEATSQALVAAKATGDVELTARALLEHARSGAEVGDYERVLAAQREVEDLLANPAASRSPAAFYVHGYCRRLLFDVRGAVRSLERALDLLQRTPGNVAELSLTYNALGVSQYNGCDFARADKSLRTALELARGMGDDSRFSLTASNLGALNLDAGNLDEAVRYCLIAIDVGTAAIRQPVLTYAYTNLAQAYTLDGKTQLAREQLEAARNWNLHERSWRVDVAFLCENANIALMQGNVPLALQQVELLERLVSGREHAVPERPVFAKLRIFRTAYIAGDDCAWDLAQGELKLFPDHCTTYYLTLLAVVAWLERRRQGECTRETRRELSVLDEVGARGLKAILTAEGFLT